MNYKTIKNILIMGQFKDIGEPSLVLMEELAEAIQVIAKKHRFNGVWDEIPEGKDKTRWQDGLDLRTR